MCENAKMALSDVERDGLDYLLSALPEADRISLDEDALLRVVRHALRVRAETPWGSAIPEGIFKAFVLFPRVNNENPEFYQGPIWAELRTRIAGKTMDEAVREINFWCYEKATYQSTDNRTANALTTVRRTFGRCGEESTLLVSALRSAGIPARQVYVPRWAHCDDNHAWVEAWVDGVWRYLGACEPEPVLDSGWFTAAASKAMLVHTRAYGVDPEGERVENVIGNARIINRTAAYAKTALLTVRVTENGAPKAGVHVRFELANMAELYPINEQITDANGEATLLTGLGTLQLHVHDGKRFVRRTVDVAAQTRCELDFGAAAETLEGIETFDQRPPRETRIQPAAFDEAVLTEHQARMRRCEEIRAAYQATFRNDSEFMRNACGNHAAIEQFMEMDRFETEDKRALLGTLREKDFVDATAEMLADALEGALPAKACYPREIWVESVLCPRVADEMLLPVRREISACFADRPADVFELWTALREKVTICDMEPATLVPDLRAVLRVGRGSEKVMDVLFVACARALGMAARLNPATGEKEYFDGEGYRALFPARQADAKLLLRNRSGRELQYGVHFTVGVLENGVYRTLSLYDCRLGDELEIAVFAGRYRVVTCTRQIDGAVDGMMIPAEVAAGGVAAVDVTMRQDSTPEKLMYAPLPSLRARSGSEDVRFPEAVAGRNAILAFAEPGKEPTEHFFNELLDAAEELRNRGIAVRLFVDHASELENEKLRQVVGKLDDIELLLEPEMADVIEWRRLMRAGDLRRPFTVAVDAQGRGLFAFANYNVGSVLSLLRVIEAQE